MIQPILFETDVSIDYLRGRDEAITYLENILEDNTSSVLLSAVTVAELFAGVREGSERRALNSFVSVFDVIPITADIAMQGGLFRRDYGKSHGVGLPDALIAATAIVHQAKLVTLNLKHFPMLQVTVPYKKTSY